MVLASSADLCAFVDASPTPFHVCATAAAQLDAAGYVRLSEGETWPTEPGRFYVVRGGSLVAWSSESSTSATDAFRVVGAHTDSPNLRLKQHHDLAGEGLGIVALEPYGGAWLNSWLDRDLGVAGRLTLRGGEDVLVHVNEPVLRIPQLAIHLSAERKGVELDPQRHLNAIWSQQPGNFLGWLADHEDLDRDDIVGFDLMTHDTMPSARIGAHSELISAPRLDNQATCFAGLTALLAAPAVSGIRPVLALFDHEEVGSTSERGAQSDLLATTLERIVLAAGGAREDLHRAVSDSVSASGDMGHATHPNYADRHEPLHHITLGGGPMLKLNVNLRYATDSVGAGVFARACEQADVPLQRFENRADLPCGSTIGPLSAARTGMLTVDVGAPTLAMHSARELMNGSDIDTYARALQAFFAPA